MKTKKMNPEQMQRIEGGTRCRRWFSFNFYVFTMTCVYVADCETWRIQAREKCSIR